MVIVGGVDYTVEEWGRYVVQKREAKYKYGGTKPGLSYDAKFITAPDAAANIYKIKSNTAFQSALNLLADWIDTHGGDYTITSADLRDFAGDLDLQIDLDQLNELHNQISVISGNLHDTRHDTSHDTRHDTRHDTSPGIVSMSTIVVPTEDSKAVLRLESATVPYLDNIVKLQTVICEQINSVIDTPEISSQIAGDSHASGDTHAISSQIAGDSHVSGGRKTALTRFDEVIIARAHPPMGLLKTGLGLHNKVHIVSFDYIDGKAVVTRNLDGLYLGLADTDAPDRSTILTPKIVNKASVGTSGNAYAWAVADSYEATYIMRMPDDNGRVVDDLIVPVTEWLHINTYGDPPHKVRTKDYIKYLRSLGFEIHVSTIRDHETRFRYMDIVNPDDYSKEIDQLKQMQEADFDKLDWSDYNKKVQAKVCAEDNPVELGGDVVIENGKIKAPKVRTGVAFTVVSHSRSLITFHSHPSMRFKGHNDERPSTNDLESILHEYSNRQLVWHFISAPEGTYIVRPTDMIAEFYKSNNDLVSNKIAEIYEKLNPTPMTIMESIEYVIKLITECGFIVYFHKNQCMPMLDVPDIVSEINVRSRGDHEKAIKYINGLSAEEITRLDFSGIDDICKAIHGAVYTMWVIGDIVIPHDKKHASVSSSGLSGPVEYPLDDPRAYHSIYSFGPFMIIYFQYEKDFPEKVHQVTLQISNKQRPYWVWCIFMSNTRITVFRDRDGVEIFGPVKRRLGRG
jgi:hypothetical protein